MNNHKDEILELIENAEELPSKTIGLLSLYAAKLIADNVEKLTLDDEEIQFFEKAAQNPGYAHINCEILFTAFYNLANDALISKFEDKFKELTI